jgi:chaperonin GroEL
MPVDFKKEVHFGPEARAELMEGINTLADAVVCTLGPNGRNVLIDQSGYDNLTRNFI